MIINLPKSVFKRYRSNKNSSIHKMAAKTSWHRYGTKLRHCHPMHNGLLSSFSILVQIDPPVHHSKAKAKRWATSAGG